MLIRFTKATGKPHTLTCTRKNGSTTRFTANAATDYFIYHDLTHYAVETVLRYNTGFYGMVANGRELNDFGTKHGKKDNRPFTSQAQDSERIVGLIQKSSWGELTYAAFHQMLKIVYMKEGEPMPRISEDQFRDITHMVRDLVNRWKALESKDFFELSFPPEGN